MGTMRHPPPRALPVLLLCLFTAGCSRGFDSPELGLRFEPPQGMGHESTETLHGRRVAQFGGGLSIVRLEGAGFGPLAGTTVEDAFFRLRESGFIPKDADVRSAKPGSIGAGPVIRYELSRGATRYLAYVLQVSGGWLLFRLQGTGSEFDTLSNRFERSLGTVKLR